jgi:hypothetical protein
MIAARAEYQSHDANETNKQPGIAGQPTAGRSYYHNNQHEAYLVSQLVGMRNPEICIQIPLVYISLQFRRVSLPSGQYQIRSRLEAQVKISDLGLMQVLLH